MRRTREQIVADLEAQGLSFHTFTLAHRSPHHPADWDWNQRDLPHIPLVHGGFRVVPGAVEEGLCTMLSLQRIAGLRFPLVVAYHHDPASPRSRVYQTALGPLALVIEASLTAVPEGTLVSTTYSVGAARALRPLLPLVERLLRRNYVRVHDEDEPLRARRAELRAWGYRFAADAEGASYARSLELDRRNVIPPCRTGEGAGAGVAPARQIPIDGGAPEVLVGRADHLGLRLDRRPGEGRHDVFPRL
jgi:hypothetical protein